MSGEIFKTKNTVDESPFDNNTWRWVRERGPLLIEEGKDGRRPGNKWGLFMQYAKSSEVAMHEDDLGRREMVMVDPLIESRRGYFDGKSCQSEFRAALLLHENLEAANRWRLGRSDGISPSDLQAIYPGKTVRELERMLGAMLGGIRYGKFLPSRQRGVLADEMRQGESIVGGGAGVAAAIEVRAQKETGKNKRGQTWVKVVSASGIVLVLASACTRVLPTTPMATDAVRPTEQANLPTTGPEDTIEPTPTPAIQITPTYSVEAAGGQYTETQLALNNSESAIKQKAVIERWLEYWGNFNNRPFDPETVELKWKYIYDDPNNPTNVFLMLEAGGEYNGRLFTIPIGADGKFVDFPPEVSGRDIQPGFGPLELSAGGEGMWLSVDENGIPVRRDGTGTIVQTLNMETRQWEVVDSRWKTPDASLAEQIKSVMPVMWVYDHESKTFVERSTDDLSFSIFERTTLYIYDKDGNEVGFARYFTESNLENKSTEYYSLVDKSTNSIIPMRLYSQMGDYIPSLGTVAPQCIFAFSDQQNYVNVPNVDQAYYDYNHTLTSDMVEISTGEELMETGLIKTIAMIKGISEDQVVSDLKKNIPIVITFGDKRWEVNKGVDFFWGNSPSSGFDVIDYRLVSYDGGQSPRTYPCSDVFVGQGIISTAMYTYYGEKIAQACSAYLSPAISKNTFIVSTVSLRRDK